MNGETAQTRIGILLNFLGEDVSNALLENLPETQAAKVRGVLNGINENPPEAYEVDAVLDEFDRFLSLVSSDLPGKSDADEAADEDLPPAEATDDPFHDLAQLSVAQLAQVFNEESPRTTATVLNSMEAEQAAAVIEELEGELGSQVFLHLQSPPVVAESIRHCIARAAFAKGRLFDRKKPIDPTSAAIERLAEMLRKMDRGSRTTMMEKLREEDEETAEAVSQKLYVFDDLLLVADRSIQGLLGEIDSATLAVAMKDGDQGIIDKILSNMSKRARATMVEEMEFLGKITKEEQEIARQSVCNAVAELDAKGDLEMEEE